MFWSNKRHDKIKVEFIEVGKDRPFAVSMVPIAQLPDTFELTTNLDIAEKKWKVIDATPKYKSDFEKSGTLRVVLSQVHIVNPKDILFSLPTINDRMCVLKKTKSLEGMLVIHEDDWRQVEFISENLLGDVQTEIQGIRKIHETRRQGIGFTELHIRKLIENPLNNEIFPLVTLKNMFSVSKEFNGFGISSYMAAAEHSFAFETANGLNFYGVLSPGGNVACLCLAASEDFGDKCGELLKTFHLVCVKWCKCQIIRG